MGTAVDGVVAKRRDLRYRSGTRNGMEKIKKLRTADCVVGGFRYLEKEPLVGSLLLGLYNKAGSLDHVGFTSSISAKARPSLTRKLQKLVKPPGFTGKAPGRAESMEQQALVGVAARRPRACGGGALRSFHRGGGFATARNSCAGALTRNLRNVRSSKWSGKIDQR